jgi:chorismate lyase/3-hydroxybenzoate synthase
MRTGYPAATAIGRQQRSGLIQVFWVAAKTPGAAVENPRQVSAYQYPRSHGPVSPSFSRATVLADGTLLISGTASIVGHVSQHPNDAAAQLAETLRNLDSLIVHARQHRDSISADAEMLLTVYIRELCNVNAVAERIRTEFPNAQTIFVAADICRRELLLEIECVVQAGK